MSTEVKLIGFGLYQKEIASYLAYQPDHYEEVKEGYPVLTYLFVLSTSLSSEALAEVLGADLWDFSTHFIDRSKIDWDRLREINPEDTVAMVDLYKHGFSFMLAPDC